MRLAVPTALLAASLLAAVLPSPVQAASFGQLGPPLGAGQLSEPFQVSARAQGSGQELFALDVLEVDAVDNVSQYRVRRLSTQDAELRTPLTFTNTSGSDRVEGVAVDPSAARNVLYVSIDDTGGGSGQDQLRSAPADGDHPSTASDFPGTAFAAAQFTGSGRMEFAEDGDPPAPVAVSPVDGSVFVAGQLPDQTPQIRRLLPTGAAAQAGGAPVRFPAGATPSDPPILAIAATPDGGLLVVDLPLVPGGSVSPPLAEDGYRTRVRRFGADGAQVGATLIPLMGSERASPEARAIAPLPDGGFVVTTAEGLAEFAADGTFARRYGRRVDGAPQACEFRAAPDAVATVSAVVVVPDRSASASRVLRFGTGGTGCGFENQPPSGTFAFAPSTPGKGQAVTFTASFTDDAGAAGLTYAWDFEGNGTFTAPSASATATHTYTTTGPRRAKVRVSDADGASALVERDVSVAGALPTAAFAFAPAAPVAGNTVQFDASASSDADGRIASYQWDLDGDGSYEVSGPGAQVARSYPAAGTVTVRLRVTDDDGSINVVARALSIAAAPVAAPPNPPVEVPPPNVVPQPQPPAPVAPRLSIASVKLVADASGRVQVKLACPAGGTTCKGTLRLATAGAVTGTTVNGRKPKKRVLSLGAATIDVRAGAATTVTLKLSPANRKLLAKAKRFSVRLSLTTTAGTATATVAKVLTLAAPKVVKRRR